MQDNYGGKGVYQSVHLIAPPPLMYENHATDRSQDLKI